MIFFKGGSVVSVVGANQYNLFIQSLNDAVAASNQQPAVDPLVSCQVNMKGGDAGFKLAASRRICLTMTNKLV